MRQVMKIVLSGRLPVAACFVFLLIWFGGSGVRAVQVMQFAHAAQD